MDCLFLFLSKEWYLEYNLDKREIIFFFEEFILLILSLEIFLGKIFLGEIIV